MNKKVCDYLEFGVVVAIATFLSGTAESIEMVRSPSPMAIVCVSVGISEKNRQPKKALSICLINTKGTKKLISARAMAWFRQLKARRRLMLIARSRAHCIGLGVSPLKAISGKRKMGTEIIEVSRRLFCCSWARVRVFVKKVLN